MTVLTDDQVEALVKWAEEGDRKHGTTSWGALFTAAMYVARSVREASQEKPIPPHDCISNDRTEWGLCLWCGKESGELP